MSLLLARWLNSRLIELRADTLGETVGVLTRDGSYRYVRWLGFVDRHRAGELGRPVKLQVNRIGRAADFGATWVDVPAGKHVQGCLTAEGVYAVVEETVRLV
jgi:hypothetical protein